MKLLQLLEDLKKLITIPWDEKITIFWNEYESIIETGYDRGHTQSDKERLYKTLEYQYLEIHHIIPKCMGGEVVPGDNTCLLTAGEHLKCHYLLTELFPENISLGYAFVRLTNGDYLQFKESGLTRDIIESVQEYSEAKERWRKQLSLSKLGENNPMFGTHWNDEERKRAASESWKGDKNPMRISPRKQGDKERKYRSERWLGENNPNFGKTFSEEYRKKLSASHVKQSKPVKDVENGVQYHSIAQCSRETGVSISKITSDCYKSDDKNSRFRFV